MILGVQATTRKGRQSVVYQIPEKELPVYRIGPARSLRRYRGADLIRYIRTEGRRAS